MAEGIYKRGKGWSIVIPYIDPTTGQRKQKWVTFHGTKREAERERIRLLRERDTGLLVADPTTWTVRAYLEHWLATYVAPNCRPKTQAGYRGIVTGRILPLLGAVPLARLTAAHVREMETTLLTKGRPGGRPLSARSVHHTHRVLHEALGHAVKWGLLPRNVCEQVDPPRPARRELRVWTAEEARQYLAVVTATNPDGSEVIPYGTALAFALETGCRQGEVLGLRWQDVDLEHGTAQIVHTIQRVQGLRGLVEGQPKTARGRRRITLTPAIVDLLRKQKARQNAWRLQLGPAWPDTGLVFTTPLGTPIDPRNLYRQHQQAIRQAGLRPIPFHNLRHTHATILLLQNVNPKIVSERLGHASVAITLDLYSQILPAMQDEAVRQLEIALRS